MKHLHTFSEFVNESVNENISFYKNVVQKAIKDALGHDVKQSDVKVGAKKIWGGDDIITLNGELLCSSSQYDEMLRWATNAIKEDPAKYGLKESVTNEAKGPDWNRKDFDDVYWKDFIDTAKKNRIKTISDLLKLMDKKLPSISGAEWDETKKILNIVESVESTVNEGDMTKFYDGFVVLDYKNQNLYKFKYVRGTSNVKVEDAAISDLAKKIKEPQSNFAVREFIKKGEWAKNENPELKG